MAPRVTRSGIFIPSLGSCDTQVELLLATSDNPGDLAFAKDTLKLFYWSGAAWFSFATASSISGTTNTLPLFTSASTIGDSVVTQSGGNLFLGASGGSAAPVSRSISGEPGLGTDIAGADLTISSGVGTGAGAPSRFILLNPEAGASSSTAQTTIVAWDRTQKSYAMADATDVAIFTVILPTSNTACGSTIGFSYQATGGGNTVSHAAAVLYVFTNNGGTVSGIGTETGETLTGTGCGIGCDAYTVTVAGTTATAKANFDNSLGVTGALRWQLYNNTCQSYVRQ